MKKIVACFIALMSILLIAACSQSRSAVFETENIVGITFKSAAPGENETEVPDEHVDEVAKWLGTFVKGEKAGDVLPPGADSIFVKIEYSDGTCIENSLDTLIDGKNVYLLEQGPKPECWFEIFEET